MLPLCRNDAKGGYSWPYPIDSRCPPLPIYKLLPMYCQSSVQRSLSSLPCECETAVDAGKGRLDFSPGVCEACVSLDAGRGLFGTSLQELMMDCTEVYAPAPKKKMPVTIMRNARTFSQIWNGPASLLPLLSSYHCRLGLSV